MATSDTEIAMNGIGTNPSLILRAPDYVADGAQIVYDSDYFDGRGVRGTAQGQKLFETEWLAAGTLTNSVIPVLYWYDGGGTVPLNDHYDAVKVLVYKRLPGSTTWTSKEMWFEFHNGLSNASGGIPYDRTTMRTASQFYWFNKNYEYKFIGFVGVLTTGAYIDVEVLKLQYMQQLGTSGPTQMTMSDERKNPNTPELIPLVDSHQWTATSTSGGVLEVYLPIAIYDGTGGLTTREGSIVSGSGFAPRWSTNPGINGNFSSLDACITMCTGFSGSVEPSKPAFTIQQYVTDLDAYTVHIGMAGLAASTQHWFCTFLYGSTLPLEV